MSDVTWFFVQFCIAMFFIIGNYQQMQVRIKDEERNKPDFSFNCLVFLPIYLVWSASKFVVDQNDLEQFVIATIKAIAYVF